MNRQAMDTQGLRRSPMRANFHSRPLKLQGAGAQAGRGPGEWLWWLGRAGGGPRRACRLERGAKPVLGCTSWQLQLCQQCARCSQPVRSDMHTCCAAWQRPGVHAAYTNTRRQAWAAGGTQRPAAAAQLLELTPCAR